MFQNILRLDPELAASRVVEILKCRPELAALFLAILQELFRAENKHVCWPCDVVHASAIVAEDSGELTKAALDFYYADGSAENMLEEAVQTGAMSLRFLYNAKLYSRKEEAKS